jgi:hypothetical protein
MPRRATSTQPPSKKPIVKEKGFLETVKDKIGSGMGYIDSVLTAHPGSFPAPSSRVGTSPAMYNAVKSKPKPAKKQ